MGNQNKKKNIKKKKQNVEQRNFLREQAEKELEIQKRKKEKIKNLIIFTIYTIILIVAALHHEPWRDEAQSWLIAKNLNFIDIISQLKYEAHPFMWYYLLRMFSILNLQYNYITIIPVFLNLIATYILLNKTKLNTFTKIIIIFSASSFFYCGILARSYSLAYLLVIILATVYKDRRKKPILYGLLLFSIMNTHILLLGFIGSIVLIDLYDMIKNKENRKQILVSLAFVIAGIAMLILQFCNTISSTGKTLHFEYLSNILNQTKQLFMPAIESELLYIITIIAIIIYMIYLVSKKEYRNFIITFLGVAFQILFATIIYNSINASSLIYLNILFVIIQSNEINKIITGITLFIFASTLYATCMLIDNDYKNLFSDSKNVAKYIEKNVDKKSKIYCELLDYCAAVNAHLPNKKYHFIDYNTGKEYTYTEYGDYYKILYDQTLYKSGDFFNKDEMDYFIGSIYNKEILEAKNEEEHYKIVYETKEKVFFSGEEYIIYKRK